jgi:N-sulfoglucosamine sulfohydrolase
VPSDVRTPGFLPDLNDVRLEVSEYYSSVRRCDDTVGAILEALQEAGADRNTLVMFLSDNGMAFPYSKTNCYLQSTKTPWIVRWPGTVRPGSVNSEHFISGIDFMPTALDAAGVAIPAGVDGRSFVPLLRGESQEGREWLFTQFYQTSGRHNYPMRCVQNKEYGYIFSPWSNGVREFDNESQVGRTMAAMKEAAQHDPAIAQRVQFFLYRVVEEFYDFKRDPDALNNLMGDKWHLYEIKALQAVLETWMLETGDSALDAFRNRGSSQVLEQYMQQVAQEIGGIS